MRHRDSSGPRRQPRDRRASARATLGSLGLTLVVCPLIGGCPPQFAPGVFESQTVVAQSPRDVAVIENAPGSSDATLAIAQQYQIIRLQTDSAKTTLYPTDTSPEDPDRLLPVVITPPTTDLLVKFKSGLCWMEGQEGGPFVTKPFIFVGPLEPFNADNFVAADFNNDQATDVALTFSQFVPPNFTTTLRVFLNDGAGVFAPGQSLPLPGTFFVQQLSAGDVNGDTRPDLMVVSGAGTRLLAGQSDGTFLFIDTTTGATSASPTTPMTGANAGLLTLFNADDANDMVLAGLNGGAEIRLGNGNGTFQPPVSRPGIFAFTMAVDDFDEDGFRDVVLAGQAPGVVAVYPGAPAGGIGPPLLLDGSNSADRVGVFYAPGDDRPDLFTVHKANNVIQTFLNTNQGWRVADRVPFVNQGGSQLTPRDALLVDINGDDYLDVAAGDTNGNLSFTLNAGDGAGTLLPTRAQDIGATIVRLEALSPLAGQGDARRPVVAIPTNSATAVVARLNTSVNPNVWAFPQTLSFPAVVTDAAAADFNGDGREDLVFSHAGAPGSISLLLQDAGGTFGAPQNVPAPGGAWNVIATLNLDGGNGDDVLLADSAAGTVHALLNNGAGGFVPGATANAPAPLSLNLAVADITGDGKPDIIVGTGPVGGASGSIHVYPSEPGGAIGSPFVIPFAKRPVRVAIGDVNGDGRADIVAATQRTVTGGDGSLGVVVNSAQGITAIPPSYHYAAGDGVWAEVGDLRHTSRGAPDGAATPTLTAIVFGTVQSAPFEGLTLLDTLPPLPAPCPGDANGDRVVDFLDLNIVLSDFGMSGAPGALQGDLDDDGDCDFVDLNIVLSAFGAAC